jgi:hypothetical protein
MHACQKCIKRVEDAAANQAASKQAASGDGWASPSAMPPDYYYPPAPAAWAYPSRSEWEPRTGRAPPPAASYAGPQANPSWRRKLFVDIPKTPRPQHQSSTPRARPPK